MVIATPLHRCQAKRRKTNIAENAITSISTDLVDFSPSPHLQSKKRGTDGDRKEHITHSSEKYTQINHRGRAVTRTAQQGAAFQDPAQPDPRQMAFLPRKFNSAGTVQIWVYFPPQCPRTNKAKSPFRDSVDSQARDSNLSTSIPRAGRPHPPGPLLLARVRLITLCEVRNTAGPSHHDLVNGSLLMKSTKYEGRNCAYRCPLDL